MWDSIVGALTDPENLLIGWNLRYMFPRKDLPDLRMDDRLAIAKMMLMYSVGTLSGIGFSHVMTAIAHQSGIPYCQDGSHRICTLAQMTSDSLDKDVVRLALQKLQEEHPNHQDREVDPGDESLLRSASHWFEVELAALLTFTRETPVSWSAAAAVLQRSEKACKEKWRDLKTQIQRYIKEDFIKSPAVCFPEVLNERVQESADSAPETDDSRGESQRDELEEPEVAGPSTCDAEILPANEKGKATRKLREKAQAELMRAAKAAKRVPEPVEEESSVTNQPHETAPAIGGAALINKIEVRRLATGSPMLDCVLADAIRNRGRTRNLYSPTSKAFWIRIGLYSDQCREFLRSLIGGPVKSTVEQWIHSQEDVDMDMFYDINRVAEALEMWRRRYDIPGHVPLSLSYDAAKVDEDLEIRSESVFGAVGDVTLEHPKQAYIDNQQLYEELWARLVKEKKLISHMFIFMVSPFAAKKAFPVHFCFSNNGSASDTILNAIDKIVTKCRESGIPLQYLGSDSDTKYRKRFNNQFQGYKTQLVAKMFAVPEISLPSPFYTNDIPHILKRIRARLVNHKALYLTIAAERLGSERNKKNVVTPQIIMGLSKSCPACAFRTGSMPSMDDYYPTKLFNWTVLREVMAGKLEEYGLGLFMYLFPATCAREIMVNKTLKKAQRLELAFYALVVNFYNWQCATSLKGRISHPLYSENIAIDLANALVSMIQILLENPQAFPLSHHGSIVDEHMFARLRYDTGNKMSAKASKARFENCILIDYLFNKGDVELKHHSRDFSYVLVEEAQLQFDQALREKVRCFSVWLAGKLAAAIGLFTEFPNSVVHPMVNYLRHHLTGISINGSAYCSATMRTVEAMLWEWKLEARMAARTVIHSAQYRCASKNGRNIIMRFSTAVKSKEDE